jgi:opacity protein-like surface antigen
MKLFSAVFSLLLLVAAVPGFAAESGSTMDFRFSPIGLIVGSLNAGLDFQVTPNWTLGPEGSFWNRHVSAESSSYSHDWDVKAFGIGLRGNWFKNGNFTDGLYVGPSLTYASVKVTNSDVSGDISGSASGLFVSGLVGYGWFWDSFNIMLGGGATMGLGDTKIEVTDSSGTKSDVSTSIAGLALEFSLGWTF